MGQAPVLLMLLASAAIAFVLIRVVIATDLAHRIEHRRNEIAVRRSAARLIAELERFRRRTG